VRRYSRQNADITGYGLYWFASSAAFGLLYNGSLPTLKAVSVTLQLAARVVLLLRRASAD
jgi:hypothetical protein